MMARTLGRLLPLVGMVLMPTTGGFSMPKVLDATLLSELQQRAAPVARSFDTIDDFEPLLTNCHVQTILGFLVREQLSYVPRTGLWEFLGDRIQKLQAKPNEKASFFWDNRERVETEDGDWFHADTKLCSEDKAAPTVLLLHGLQSNSNSSNSMELARGFNRMGLHCVCLNFRGCSGESNDRIGGYHIGFTNDLKHYIKLFRSRHGYEQPIYLSGFSLGANVVLKCLGELGPSAKDLNVAGAAVVAAPLDQARNAAVLGRPGGVNRFIYTKALLESLQERAEEQLHRFCDGDPNKAPFDYAAVQAARTITDFDDAFIAKIYGFASAADYYHQTSSLRFLDRIAVPTAIINAEDDPFFDSNVWPAAEEHSHLKLIRTRHGGHLGYQLHQVDDTDPRLQQKRPSWVSWEAARFLHHVHTFDDSTR